MGFCKYHLSKREYRKKFVEMLELITNMVEQHKKDFIKKNSAQKEAVKQFYSIKQKEAEKAKTEFMAKNPEFAAWWPKKVSGTNTNHEYHYEENLDEYYNKFEELVKFVNRKVEQRIKTFIEENPDHGKIIKQFFNDQYGVTKQTEAKFMASNPKFAATMKHRKELLENKQKCWEAPQKFAEQSEGYTQQEESGSKPWKHKAVTKKDAATCSNDTQDTLKPEHHNNHDHVQSLGEDYFPVVD